MDSGVVGKEGATTQRDKYWALTAVIAVVMFILGGSLAAASVGQMLEGVIGLALIFVWGLALVHYIQTGKLSARRISAILGLILLVAFVWAAVTYGWLSSTWTWLGLGALSMVYLVPIVIGLAFVYAFWRLLWAIIHRLER
jgi:hypothetical protein